MTSGNETDANSQARSGSPMTAGRIQRQLQRILTNPAFRATKAQKAFLKFVVRKTLSGNAMEIKGYTVATRVFGRREDFDQSTDPIVSIQANKLRRALEHYYLTVGDKDPVHIEIPKGSYVPNFTERVAEHPALPRPENEPGIPRFKGSWPAVVIRPFQNLTGDPDLDYMGIGLAAELATEITRYQEIRVLQMQHRGEAQRRVENTGARFVLDGSIQRGASGLKVNVSLVDVSTGHQIWGDSYRTDCSPSRLIAFQEEVANTIAGKIISEYGIIAKTFSHESKQHPPSELKTYEDILRY